MEISSVRLYYRSDRNDKAAFPFMRIIYPTDLVRTVFVRVTNSDQTIFSVGVSFRDDFCTDK